MATFRRAIAPGATYFFTVNTYRRQMLLTDPPVYSALREALRAVKRGHPFTIEAFVLLPDHLRCLWTVPEGDTDYALRWKPRETEGKPTGEVLDYEPILYGPEPPP